MKQVNATQHAVNTTWTSLCVGLLKVANLKRSKFILLSSTFELGRGHEAWFTCTAWVARPMEGASGPTSLLCRLCQPPLSIHMSNLRSKVSRALCGITIMESPYKQACGDEQTASPITLDRPACPCNSRVHARMSMYVIVSSQNIEEVQCYCSARPSVHQSECCQTVVHPSLFTGFTKSPNFIFAACRLLACMPLA